jgi:hypothetical protein
MRKTKQKIVLLALLCLTVAHARAAWSDLKEGLDPKAVMLLVGQPLIANQARGGALITWTFDDGGYILFENGRLKFWQAPRPKKTG